MPVEKKQINSFKCLLVQQINVVPNTTSEWNTRWSQHVVK